MYRNLIEEELVIMEILDDHVVVSIDEVPLIIPKDKFTVEFWKLFEVGAILTWRIYSWMGKPTTSFTIKFPWKRGL